MQLVQQLLLFGISRQSNKSVYTLNFHSYYLNFKTSLMFPNFIFKTWHSNIQFLEFYED